MSLRKKGNSIENWITPLFFTSSMPQAIFQNRELIEYNEAFAELIGVYGDKQLKNRPVEWFFPFFQKDGSLSGEGYRDYMELAKTIGAQKFDWHMGLDGEKQVFVEVSMDFFEIQDQDYFLCSYFDIGNLLQELIVQREELLFGVN